MVNILALKIWCILLILIRTVFILTHRPYGQSQIFPYFLSKNTKGIHFTKKERDVQEVGITCEDEDFQSDTLKLVLGGTPGFPEKIKLRTGKAHTEERKEQY